MTPKALLLTLGGVLLLAGLVLGLVPVKAQGVNCGSALKGNDFDANVADYTDAFMGIAGNASESCADRRSTYQPIVWTLFAVGTVLLVGSTFIAPRPTAADISQPERV